MNEGSFDSRRGVIEYFGGDSRVELGLYAPGPGVCACICAISFKVLYRPAMVHFSPLRLLLNCVKGNDLFSSLDFDVNFGGLALAVIATMIMNVNSRSGYNCNKIKNPFFF
jgi:hypothetical protein